MNTNPHLINQTAAENQPSTFMEEPEAEQNRAGSIHDLARYAEPPYASFYCPLTSKIMEDPVTVRTGETYERKAIAQQLERRGVLDEPMLPNMALKAIIEEWKERNEKAKIRVIHAALSLGSSEVMVMEALKDLGVICQRRDERRREVRERGIIPLVVKLLGYEDSKIRHGALEILQLLAEDDEGKELVGKTAAIPAAVRMISSRFQPVKHAALLLLVELSKSVELSEKIGRGTGCVLMLVRSKYERSSDTFASEAANQILQNLAQSPGNIKRMAENGFLEPLLDNLVDGPESMKAEMASYLAEVVLGDDANTIVAKRACPTLIDMTQSENAATRKAALQALVAISSLHQNAELLVEAGTAQIIVEQMITRNMYTEAADAPKEAAQILANLLESGFDIRETKVTTQGHTLTSDYVLSNIMYLLTTSIDDELSLSLIRSISCLMMWCRPKILSAIRDTEVCYTLLEFISVTDEQLGVAAIKLLVKLAPHMGQILVEKVCKISAEFQGFFQITSNLTQITERQVFFAKFLAALPHENIQLNLSLLNTVATVQQAMNEIQKCGIRQSRYDFASVYLEGLVGILVRFTATLYEPQILDAAVSNDFTTIFKDLMMESNSAEVKRLAATGLEKLSVQTVNLSKPPKVERRSSMNSFHSPRFLSSRQSGKNKMTICPVHRGVCSGQTTFCLIESRAVESLLMCLDHQDSMVVEAALSAVSTLLDENLDMEKSAGILHEMKATEQVMKVVKRPIDETLLQKAIWMMERLIRKGGDEVSAFCLKDKKFVSTLVNSLYHGEAYTRQIAEKVLTHLKFMPGSTITFA